VERLRAPQPILIYGRKDRAHVIDPDVASSRSRALTSSASTCGRLTLGRQLCRCPKKVRTQLHVSQREGNYPGRSVRGERIRGRQVACVGRRWRGVRRASSGDVPELVRLVRAYPSNQTEGDHLCRYYGFMSRPIVRFGAAIPMVSAASCILYTGCELAISSSARAIRRMGRRP